MKSQDQEDQCQSAVLSSFSSRILLPLEFLQHGHNFHAIKLTFSSSTMAQTLAYTDQVLLHQDHNQVFLSYLYAPMPPIEA